MAKYFHTDQPFGEELRRIIEERTENSLEALADTGAPDEAVHQARKQFKKIRAAWRLIRDDIGEKAYKEKNVFYRDLGRRLSGLRDARAVIETLHRQQEKYGSVIYKKIFEKTGSALEGVYVDNFEGHRADLLREVREDLAAHRTEINAFKLGKNFPGNVLSSLVRVYKRGYRLFKKNRAEPADVTLHTWRKRTKYLRYQFHILRGVWPRMFHAYEKALHDLTDILGEYNDLVMLKKRYASLQNDLGFEMLHVQMLIAESQQEHLADLALKEGQKLYAEKPGAFKKRMKKTLLDEIAAK